MAQHRGFAMRDPADPAAGKPQLNVRGHSQPDRVQPGSRGNQPERQGNIGRSRTPGREFVDRARAALPADEVARATEVGRRLTIREALDLARIPETASV
jgi:hypothetical protein